MKLPDSFLHSDGFLFVCSNGLIKKVEKLSDSLLTCDGVCFCLFSVTVGLGREVAELREPLKNIIGGYEEFN